MAKVITIALALGIVLYMFFYLPQRLKPGRGARIRHIIASIIAFLFAVALLKIFL